MIDKKITGYTLLITLAIASTPIPTYAMETPEQQRARLRRGRNAGSAHSRPRETWRDANSSSASASSGSESDSIVYGSKDRSDEEPISTNRPRPRPSGFDAMGGHGHRPTHHATHQRPRPNSTPLQSLRPDKKVSGGRYPIPICRGVIVCGVIAFVVALTQMYTRKQRQAKKDKNNPKAKKSNCATFGDENTLYA